MSYFHETFENAVKRVNNNEEPNLTDDNMDDEEIGEEALDPSLIAPDGLTRRVTRSSIQHPPDVMMRRPALTVARKHEQYHYEMPHKRGFRETLSHSAKKKTTCSKKCVRDTFYLRLPISNWLFHYKFSRDLLNDVISGITVAVMHIPQGMAYAMLANLDPIIGIYMAFFPVLIYATFSSSRHCSVGTFAVVCIMVGKVVAELSTPENGETTTLPSTLMETTNNATAEYSPIEVASILSFAVGIWMLIFGVFQMGSLCVFLSDMLVSGFTTGASIHVLTSQVPKLFGANVTSYQGVLKIPKTWGSIFANIMYSNPATMVISLICLFILVLNNEVLKPRLRKLTRIPFPIELVVVIGGTLASTYGHLNEHFDVEIVGEIPTGLPPATAPPFDLLGQVIISSLTIAIVSYTVSFSMAKIFGKKLDYSVDATQELYALGLGNLMGSIFSCGPIAASLSRSLIQQSVGGATQLASYISCSILILVLLFIGPFFETLPNCVLASIIAVALKGMFLQSNDFFRMWKVSRVDALLWLITFLGVVILDIDYGLLLGIVVSLLLLIIRNHSPIMMILGRIADTDIYLDKTRYAAAVEVPGIKICQVLGNLHFANQDSFRQNLAKMTGLDPKIIMKWKKKQEKILKKKLKEDGISNIITLEDGSKNISNDSGNENGCVKTNQEKSLKNNSFDNLKTLKTNSKLEIKIPEVVSLIIDFSGVCQIDISAAKNLVQLQKEYEAADIVAVFAALSEPSLEVISKCCDSKEMVDNVFFHSVPDAIAFLSMPPDESSQSFVPPEVVAHL